MSEHGNGSQAEPIQITIRVFADGRLQIDHPTNLPVVFWILELAQDAVKAKATKPSMIARV